MAKVEKRLTGIQHNLRPAACAAPATAPANAVGGVAGREAAAASRPKRGPERSCRSSPLQDNVATLGFPLADRQQSGLSENLAALLSYALGWITGLIFFLLDKRPYVRFHAAQSIVVFLGLHILRSVVGLAFGMGWWFRGFGNWGFASLGGLLLNLVSLVSLILWIVLMVKAFQGVRFKVPLAGDIAESLSR